MSEPSPTTDDESQENMSHPGMPTWLTFLLASACGLIVANLYYTQPLVGPISESLNMPPQSAGLIVTLSQIGYAIGLLFIVPLSDLMENRKLVLAMLILAGTALALGGTATDARVFLGMALVVGIGSVAVQILVPYSAHLAPPGQHGRVVGNVISGLMLGIMLARPVASYITYLSSWHMVFAFSVTAMLLLAVTLGFLLPPRKPETRLPYHKLLGSMASLARNCKLLRRRSVGHALLFAAFSLFWTVAPLELSRTFNLSQAEIALFALAGVAGVIAAPIAGRLADRNLCQPATILAMLLTAGSFLLTHVKTSDSTAALMMFAAAGILLDFGISMNLVISQRAIFALDHELRGRLNGIFMATFFTGGAAGSALGAWAYAREGWATTSLLGVSLPLAALVYLATDRKREVIPAA